MKPKRKFLSILFTLGLLLSSCGGNRTSDDSQKVIDDSEHQSITTESSSHKEENPSSQGDENPPSVVDEDEAQRHEIKKLPESLLHFEKVDGITVTKIGKSHDGYLYVFGKRQGENTHLLRSNDSGLTYEKGIPITSFGGETLISFCVYSDGSICFITTGGKIWHTTSFDIPPIITFTGEDEFAVYGSDYYEHDGTKYVFAGEYNNTSTVKKMWLSENGGLSFTLLKVGDTLNDGNNHWHAGMYDPYDKSYWLSQGDGLNSRIYHSYDKVNWEKLEGIHPTVIYPFPNRVVFGRDRGDRKPGIDYWERSEAHPLVVHDGITFKEEYSASSFVPHPSCWDSYFINEYYFLFPLRAGTESFIYGTGDGGASWHMLYTGETIRDNITRVRNDDYVYALDSSNNLYKAKSIKWI